VLYTFHEFIYFNDSGDYMITTVTQKNMVTIPADVARALGIKPGYKLDWLPVEGKDEIIIRVIPDRAELARRLMGMGAHLAPERDVIAELDEEREREDLERMRELG
jgi:AbrB family looped-hinge helix DNA binding protein